MHQNNTETDCGHPPIIFNGTMSYQNTTEGSEAHYHWVTPEGELTAICREDGRWSLTHVCRSYSGMVYIVCTFAQGILTMCIYSARLCSAAIRKKFFYMLPSQVTNIYSSQTGIGNSLRTYCHKVGCLYYNANYHTVDERYLLKYPVKVQ